MYQHLTSIAADHNFIIDGTFAVCMITGAAYELRILGKRAQVFACLRGSDVAGIEVGVSFGALRSVVDCISVYEAHELAEAVEAGVAAGALLVRQPDGHLALCWAGVNRDGNPSTSALTLAVEIKRQRYAADADRPVYDVTAYPVAYMPKLGAKWAKADAALVRRLVA
jgi:hypothetical protein